MYKVDLKYEKNSKGNFAYNIATQNLILKLEKLIN